MKTIRYPSRRTDLWFKVKLDALALSEWLEDNGPATTIIDRQCRTVTDVCFIGGVLYARTAEGLIILSLSSSTLAVFELLLSLMRNIAPGTYSVYDGLDASNLGLVRGKYATQAGETDALSAEEAVVIPDKPGCTGEAWREVYVADIHRNNKPERKFDIFE